MSSVSVIVISFLLLVSILAGSPFGMFPAALLQGACLFLSINPRHDSRPAVLAVEKVIDLLGEVRSSQLAVLGSRAGLLAFDNDAGRKVLELDG